MKTGHRETATAEGGNKSSCKQSGEPRWGSPDCLMWGSSPHTLGREQCSLHPLSYGASTNTSRARVAPCGELMTPRSSIMSMIFAARP